MFGRFRQDGSYDFKALVDFQMQSRGIKLDAGETAVFARELEEIQAQVYEVSYPEYKAFSILPIKSENMAGARSHTWREMLEFGDAEMLETHAPEDFPTVDVQGKENTGVFRGYGAKYLYSLEDLAAGQTTTINVEEHKGRLARRVIDSRLDRAMFLGDGPFTVGIGTNSFANDDTASLLAAEINWTTATADQIAEAFRKVAASGFNATNTTFENFDFLVSGRMWTTLGKRFNTYNDKSILQYILDSVPGVRSITYSPRLQGLGGGANFDRMVAFPRDPAVVQAYIPVRFYQMAPQLRGMVFETYCAAKYGGIRIYQPTAIRRVNIQMA